MKIEYFLDSNLVDFYEYFEKYTVDLEIDSSSPYGVLINKIELLLDNNPRIRNILENNKEEVLENSDSKNLYLLFCLYNELMGQIKKDFFKLGLQNGIKLNEDIIKAVR